MVWARFSSTTKIELPLYNIYTRVQPQTCTSWQWWVVVGTPMGCPGSLGPLMAEVSLAWICVQYSLSWTFFECFLPLEKLTTQFSIVQAQHDSALSYQSQLVEQPIFLSPKPSPWSIPKPSPYQLVTSGHPAMHEHPTMHKSTHPQNPHAWLNYIAPSFLTPHYAVGKLPRLCK